MKPTTLAIPDGLKLSKLMEVYNPKWWRLDRRVFWRWLGLFEWLVAKGVVVDARARGTVTFHAQHGDIVVSVYESRP